MKNIAKKFGQGVITILLVSFFIFAILLLLLYTPIDFIRYRNTRFYKDTKEKYTWFATNSNYVRLYNAIMNAKLPIRYYRDKTNKFTGYGYFICGTTVILNDYQIQCDEKTNAYTVEVSEDEFIPVEEAATRDIQKFNDFMKAEVADRAVILIENEEIFKDSIPKFGNCEILLIAKSSIAEVLQSFFKQ